MIRIMYSSAAHWMKLKGRINRSIRRYVVAAGCVAVNRDGDERFEIRNATSVGGKIYEKRDEKASQSSVGFVV
jgi:hypothetical protein